MFKYIATICLLISVTTPLSGQAKTLHKKKKRKVSTSKAHRHARISRHYHHGNGPDLKSITTESPYKEDPTNGVNPVENKQPGN
jgi:hypothetical protein